MGHPAVGSGGGDEMAVDSRAVSETAAPPYGRRVPGRLDFALDAEELDRGRPPLGRLGRVLSRPYCGIPGPLGIRPERVLRGPADGSVLRRSAVRPTAPLPGGGHHGAGGLWIDGR